MVYPYLLSTVGFDQEKASAWRSKTYGLKKAKAASEQITSLFGNAFDTCMALSDYRVVSATPICAGIMALKVFMELITVEFDKEIDLSEHLYTEIVDKQDDDAKDEQHSAIYDNVITIHGNILATYSLLSNVMNSVGKIQTKVNARRLEVIDCTSTTLGYVDNCNKPSCEDPTRYCDGSFNYEYISRLERGEIFNRAVGHYLCFLSCGPTPELYYFSSF